MFKCNFCHKSYSELDKYFHRSSILIRGYKYTCKICQVKLKKKWVKKNREHIRQYVKLYRMKNPDVFIAQERRRRKNPKRVKLMNQYSRNWSLRNKNVRRIHSKTIRTIKQLKSCEVCSSNINIVRHHLDYKKELDVIFLCRLHHQRFHARVNKKEVCLYNTGRKIKKLLTEGIKII